MTQKTTTYLATAVRYFANPCLRGNAQETPEMGSPDKPGGLSI